MTRPNALLLVVSLLISALVAEAVVRAAGFGPREMRVNRYFEPDPETTWSVPDAELGWINKSGVSRSIEQGHALMTFWDGGRRATRDDEARNSNAVVDVMMIGDSYTQSYGVADSDSFVYRLGQHFAHANFENFGTGGYSHVQALMMAKRALSSFYKTRKPHLIVLGYNDDNNIRNVADQSWIYTISDPEGRYVVPPHYRLVGDELRLYPFKIIDEWPFELKSALVTVAHDSWLKSFVYNTADQTLPVTRRTISEIAQLALRNEIDFAIVVLQDRSMQHEAVLSELNVPIIDCSGFERSAPETYLLGGGGHPNAKFHAHYADCFAPWLAKYFDGVSGIKSRSSIQQ